MNASDTREDLCIRFVNTKAWRLRQPGEERLGSPGVLLGWLAANDLADPVREEDGSSAAEALHVTAIRLRESIYEIFYARIQDREAASDDLRFFTEFLARAGAGMRLEPGLAGLHWRQGPGPADPTGLLWPVALSAADLMTGPRAARVRQCQDDRGCGWLFVDESRAQNRRWCSMGDCGNRAKAHRHYDRIKAQRKG
ncbi:MAG TPA: ABATE domain-containing protein [Aliidongia sp.]|uniref:CGNR zinc finger domain-containing protein n=1 Tax=Aliidongia sp. TaxID=1914230 RepID=UPI002DDC9F6C|nr:ABATE domain-containing protein [Aliidongia sp.]HEV2673599.1 ABATE domain-containing protein [Aliidongia sp.]